MYSGGGGGHGGGGGGILGLIAELSGQNEMSGGPEVDPVTGKVIFKPYQGSGGFLGGKSRRRAEAGNAEIAGARYLSQEDHKEAIALQEKINALQKELETHKNDLDALKGNRGVLNAKGYVANKDNIEKYDKSLTDKSLANEEKQLDFRALYNSLPTTPNEEAMRYRALNQELAAKNFATMAQFAEAGPNSIRPLTKPGDITAPYQMLHGPTVGTRETMQGQIMDPKTKQMFGGTPVKESVFGKGYLEVPTDPANRNAVQETPAPPSTVPETINNNPNSIQAMLGNQAPIQASMFGGIQPNTTVPQFTVAPDPANQQVAPPAISNPAQLAPTNMPPANTVSMPTTPNVSIPDYNNMPDQSLDMYKPGLRDFIIRLLQAGGEVGKDIYGAANSPIIK